MSGKKHRQKGDRLERAMVIAFQEHGLEAKRVPLSGATNFAKGDIVVKSVRMPWTDSTGNAGAVTHFLTGECKSRKTLPKYYAEWLKDCDFVVMKADRQKAVILMDFEMLVELLGGEV